MSVGVHAVGEDTSLLKIIAAIACDKAARITILHEILNTSVNVISIVPLADLLFRDDDIQAQWLHQQQRQHPLAGLGSLSYEQLRWNRSATWLQEHSGSIHQGTVVMKASVQDAQSPQPMGSIVRPLSDPPDRSIGQVLNAKVDADAAEDGGGRCLVHWQHQCAWWAILFDIIIKIAPPAAASAAEVGYLADSGSAYSSDSFIAQATAALNLLTKLLLGNQDKSIGVYFLETKWREVMRIDAGAHRDSIDPVCCQFVGLAGIGQTTLGSWIECTSCCCQ